MTQTAIDIHRPSDVEVPTTITPMTMIDRALATGATAETLERLLALQERWEASQARKAFDEAMALAKADIPIINKNRTVDFTSSKGRTHYRHEDLAEIAATVNPILSKNGLSYRFRTMSAPNEPVVVTCILTHRQGHYEETTLAGPRDDSGNKNAIQQVGSTLTYLQRMTLKAALGLAASDDDDGRKSEEPVGKINAAQVSRILALIEETGSDTQKFCQYMGVEAVVDITATELPRALAMLERKKREATNG